MVSWVTGISDKCQGLAKIQNLGGQDQIRNCAYFHLFPKKTQKSKACVIVKHSIFTKKAGHSQLGC